MDRFDDIWKNRFNEEELPVGDWNAPDDMVWDSIAAEVLPKKKKRQALWFWLSLGVVLLLVTMAIFIGNGKDKQSEAPISKDQTTSRLISTETSNNNLITKNQTIETSTIGDSKNTNTFKGENISVNVSPSGVRNNNTNTFYKKPTQSDFTIDNSSIKNSFSTQPVEGKNILSNQSNTKVKIPISKDKMSTRAKETIYIIPNSELLLNEPLWAHPILNLSLLADEEFMENLNPDLHTFGKITLSANGGATFWKHRISNQYTSDLSPFDFNYKDGMGWSTNLNMNISLGKKWDAFVGLQYEQVKTTSGHNSQLTYNPDEEVTDPLNGYVLSLATPYGLSGATFNFNRVENIGSDEVDLLVDFHSKHTIRNISIPVGVMLSPFGKNRKLVPSTTLGFGVNYLSKISNEIDYIESNHSAIQFDDSGSSTFVDADVNNWHYDVRVGVGLNYHLTRRLNLNLNYNFSKGLNPIFELDNYNTRIDRHHISLGLTTKISR